MLNTTTVRADAVAIRAAMDAAGKSTRAVAREADCAPSRIAQLASGKDPGVAVATAVAIAAALDKNVNELFSFPDGETLIRLGLIRPVD